VPTGTERRGVHENRKIEQRPGKAKSSPWKKKREKSRKRKGLPGPRASKKLTTHRIPRKGVERNKKGKEEQERRQAKLESPKKREKPRKKKNYRIKQDLTERTVRKAGKGKCTQSGAVQK